MNIMTAREAANLVSDGDTLVTDGFIGSCFAEELAISAFWKRARRGI
jgi:acyl CoA:acetate/3-ketoacid CoA transferase alpha subunit